jgi:hypothetical protein
MQHVHGGVVEAAKEAVVYFTALSLVQKPALKYIHTSVASFQKGHFHEFILHTYSFFCKEALPMPQERLTYTYAFKIWPG